MRSKLFNTSKSKYIVWTFVLRYTQNRKTAKSCQAYPTTDTHTHLPRSHFRTTLLWLPCSRTNSLLSLMHTKRTRMNNTHIFYVQFIPIFHSSSVFCFLLAYYDTVCLSLCVYVQVWVSPKCSYIYSGKWEQTHTRTHKVSYIIEGVEYVALQRQLWLVGGGGGGLDTNSHVQREVVVAAHS